MKKTVKTMLIGLWFAALAIPCISKNAPQVNSAAYKMLSAKELGAIVGGGCKDCRFSGERIDECYHAGYFDACSTSQCISNYSIEDTCDPGTGTCSAILDANKVAVVQYRRQDTNCATSSSGISTWFTHYYGAGCQARLFQVRCIKNNGECNGTLIDTGYRTPGIDCP